MLVGSNLQPGSPLLGPLQSSGVHGPPLSVKIWAFTAKMYATAANTSSCQPGAGFS